MEKGMRRKRGTAKKNILSGNILSEFGKNRLAYSLKNTHAFFRAHLLYWSVTLLILLEDDVAMLAFIFS